MEKDSMQVVNDEIPDPREIIEVTFDFYPELNCMQQCIILILQQFYLYL